MRFNTLEAWLAWLEKPHINSINLGLDRVQKISNALKINKFSSKIVTVAGTNGKGSTIAALNAILELPHQGLTNPKIGVYTSPHLINYTERIKVNGNIVCDIELMQAFEIVDQCRLKFDIYLTYFEFTTLVALLIFSKSNLDYILLEVGLGGRLDAVNIVDADLAIITSIGIDHQEWLGHSREEIAFEKAGILRSNKPCIISDIDPPQSLKQEILKLNCKAFFISSSDLSPKNFRFFFDNNTDNLSLVGHHENEKNYSLSGLPKPRLSVESWSAAFQAAILLDAKPSFLNCASLMKNLTLEGRQQSFHINNREIILDVAHNLESIKYLIEHLNASNDDKSIKPRLVAIFACMKDKDFKQMINLMKPLVRKWYFPFLSGNARAIYPHLLERTLKECCLFPMQKGKLEPPIHVEISKSVKDSLINAIHNGSQDDRIVVFGSFYTVAEAITFLEDLC